MAGIPGYAKGYGNNSTAQNVFKINFDEDLSSAPYIEAWDNSESFPVRDTQGSTATNDIFASGGSDYPMLSAVATTSDAPSSDWMPSEPAAGAATANRLMGTTNRVQDPTTPAGGSGGDILFNMVCEIPSSAEPSMSYSHIMQVRYTYTGTTPTVTWYFNDEADGGTEAVPVWVALTPGTDGFRHAAAGAGAANYYANIPYTGNEITTVGWVTV